MLALVGGVALYARQEIFDADNFARRAAVSLRNGDVRSEISDQIVDQIIEQGSGELIQAKPLLEAVVSNVLDSAPFRSIFRKAVVQVHRAVFSRDEGSIVLDLAAAQRLVGRIGFGELKGKDDLYLCHTLCEIGATKLVTGLRQLKDFLDDYPNEVVMVFIQDAISPQSTAQAFREAGLESRLYVHARNDDWPTLRQMIRSGRRVFVLAEETTTGGPPWYHQGFDLVQETPYTFTSPEALEAPSSCRLNRGTPNSPLFQLNHWIERVNPSPALARRVNSSRVLLRRAQRCERIRGLLPNLVNVDFYDEGDVFGAVRVLNGLPRTARPTYLRSR